MKSDTTHAAKLAHNDPLNAATLRQDGLTDESRLVPAQHSKQLDLFVQRAHRRTFRQTGWPRLPISWKNRTFSQVQFSRTSTPTGVAATAWLLATCIYFHVVAWVLRVTSFLTEQTLVLALNLLVLHRYFHQLRILELQIASRAPQVDKAPIDRQQAR